MSFKTQLSRLIGRPIIHPTRTVTHDGTVSQDEIRGLWNLFKHVFGVPVKLEPPGPPNVYLTTDDIDKTTGKPYLDYLERRVLRARARETYGKDLGDLHPGDHEGWDSHPR